MGLLDLFRRRPDRTDAPVSAEGGEASSDASSGLSVGTSEVQRAADDGGVESVPAPSAPRAWELLRPMAPLSHTPIHRTFDPHPGASLRTQRRADDLFVSSSLGHTVDPNASGTVDGLMQVTAAGSVRDFPAFGSGGDRVLRRRTLGAEELASADASHPRWPILAAATSRQVSPAAVSSPGVPSLARTPSTDSVSRVAELDAPTFGGAPAAGGLDDASGNFGVDALDTAPATGTVDLAGESLDRTSDGGDNAMVHRSADLVGASALNVTSLPLLRSSLARSLDVVSDAPRPSLITRVAASEPAPIAQARTVAASTVGSVPVARVVDSPVRPTLASTPSSAAPSISRSADDAAEAGDLAGPAAHSGPIDRSLATGPAPSSPAPSAAVLRRRSIVEVRSETGSIGSGGPSGVAADASSPSGESGADSDATAIGMRAAESVGSPSTVQRSESPASVPTLGRRAGLGAPMTELPTSATTDDGPANPFGAVYGQDHFDAMLRRANRVDRVVSADGAGGMATGALASSSAGGGVSFAGSGPASNGSPAAPASAFPILRVVDDSESDSSSWSTSLAETPTYESSTSGTQTVGREASAVLRSFGDELLGGGASSPDGAPSAAIHRTVDLPLVGSRALTLASGPAAPVLSGLGGASPAQAPAAVPLQRSPGSPVASSSSRLGVASEPAASIETGVFGGNNSSFDHVIARSVAPVPSLGAPTMGAGISSGPVPVLPLLRSVDDSSRGSVGAAFTGPASTTPGAVPSVRAVSGSSGEGTMAGTVHRSISGMPTPPSIQPVAPPPTQSAQPASPTPTTSPAQSANELSPAQPAAPSGEAAGGAGAGGGGASGGGDGGDGAGGGGAATGGGSGTGPSSATAEAELDQLAGKLYERLRFRLRRELLDDRERAGLVLDRVR